MRNTRTYISNEILVSICPDDFDGDLIIDNIDVDLDNDGILNCDESFGDATLNITDINNPQIIFQDNSTIILQLVLIQQQKLAILLQVTNLEILNL